VKKISFDSKDYVRAADIAEQFRYTQDYVGQLCRSGKVDARLVGRAWFVYPESVVEYRKTKHTPTISPDAPTKKAEKIAVNPVIRPKTARTVASSASIKAGSPKQSESSYDKDTAAAIPPLHDLQNNVPEKSPVVSKPSPSKSVRIKVRSSTKKGTKYAASSEPEIVQPAKCTVKETVSELVQPAESISKDISLTSKAAVSIPDESILSENHSGGTATLSRYAYYIIPVLATLLSLVIVSASSHTQTSASGIETQILFEWETLVQVFGQLMG